jgi:hypothetical protein
MDKTPHRQVTVKHLFRQQVIINFIVVGVLIVIGALLVFKVQGESYTQLTAVGFMATVFFSFVTFLPAGTLFAARAEVVQGKVKLGPNETTGATQPLADPYRATLPLGFAAAAACSAVVCALVYGTGWMPSPISVTLISLLFVVPYALIVRQTIFRDVEGLIAVGPFKAKQVASRTGHIWTTYIVPNLVFQLIINMPLAGRGFGNLAAQFAQVAGPGMVPVAALAPDFAITFVFVCGFTFLGVIAHTAADLYEGNFAYRGSGNGINGLLFFFIILAMGILLGASVIVGVEITGIALLPLAVALMLKALVVFLSVYAACRMGVGWMGKKFNHAVALKTEAMPHAA